MRVTSSLAAAACFIFAFTQIIESQTTNGESSSDTARQPERIVRQIQADTGKSGFSFSGVNGSDPSPSGLLAPLDEKFVADTIMSDNAVIMMGDIAQQKATYPSVRAYAERSVRHCAENNEEMAQLAAEIGVKLPEGVALNDQFVINGLQGLTGANFDQAYVRQQMGLQAVLIDTYREAEKKAKDKRLRSFAKNRRQYLEEQYQLLRELDNRSSPAMSMVIKVDN